MPETVRAKVLAELIELLKISAYIYVCLVALLLYSASIDAVQKVSFAHAGYAVVKALVLGKFILMGHWLNLGEHSRSRLIYSVLYQALALWMLLIVLLVLEEAVVALLHGHSPAAALSELRQSSLLRLLARSLVLLLALLPYVAYRQLDAFLGRGRLRTIFLGDRAEAALARNHTEGSRT
jgi:hypothetical protein